MEFVIWGAGKRGKHVLYQIGKEHVRAFVDKDPKKQEKGYLGIDVISLEEYIKDYQNFFIIISFLDETSGINVLKEYGISQYLLLSDCPGEFQENYERKILQNHIKGLIDKKRKYGVTGGTLFSFLVYQWMKEKCETAPCYLAENFVSEKAKEILEKNGYILRLNTEETEAQVDEIFLCRYISGGKSLKEKKKRYLYDCSDEIAEYYNPLIDTYRNLHEGGSCFIVATGPSLQVSDLEILQKQNVFCISMNSIWHIFPQTLWRPFYYVADDYEELLNLPKEVENSNDIIKFLGDTSEEFWEKQHPASVIKHHFNYEYTENRMPEFSEDFSKQCYMGSTVTYSCLQLAAYMGFRTIYLLGVDFSYAENNGEKYAHFYAENNLVATGYTKQVTLAYQSAKQYADSHGIEIYNATRGGKLEVFPRVDFDELFAPRGSR